MNWLVIQRDDMRLRRFLTHRLGKPWFHLFGRFERRTLAQK
jgi:hypothetical protein